MEEGEKVWERSIGAAVQIPLDFSQGMYYRSFSGGLSINHTAIPSLSDQSDLNSSAFQFTTIGVESRFSITKRSAYQNISTPLGIAGELSLNRSVSSISASQLQLFLDVGVRGFMPNHNFIFDFSYKSESIWNEYQYLDVNSYPRGYTIPKINWLATYQFNYHFPIMYPDFGFLGLAYIKRIRGNLFTDYAVGEILNGEFNSQEYKTFFSVGAELIFDLKIFNFIPISMGLRISALGNIDTYDPSRNYKLEPFLALIRL